MFKGSAAVIVCCGFLALLSCRERNGDQESSEIGDANAQGDSIYFTGTYLDGTPFDSVQFEGQKLVFGFFSYKHRDALPMIQGLQKIVSFERKYNFKIILISIDYGNTAAVQKFIADNKIDLPVVLEGPSLAIAMQLKVENEVSVYGLGSDHDIVFEVKKYTYPHSEEGVRAFLDDLKDGLKIREVQSTEPRVGIYPAAPDFTVKTLKGQNLSLSSYKGSVVLLVFFSPQCPHCRDELQYLSKQVYNQYKSKGLEVVALSTATLEGETLAAYDEDKYSWPVADDHLRKVHKLYSPRTVVPETYFIDREGRIRYRSYGFAPSHGDLFTYRIKQLLGLVNTPTLSDKKFSGVDVCAACHEAEYVSWSVTPHAQAWETLEVQGSDLNPKCVLCHSLGANDPKGYMIKKDATKVGVPPLLVDVQCENCHGLGGPHVTPTQDVTEDSVALNKRCLTCHTSEYSLHFSFDERNKKTNHSDAAKVMRMSPEERLALLNKVSKKPADLFDVSREYVGVEKCLTCHGDIVQKWKQSFHAKAFTSLKVKGNEKDAVCLSCHTTGYGEATGYTAHVGDQNFESVSCESCHGPSSVHIKTSKKTDVQALGSECDFCVKGQICNSCHDEANSPNFNLKKGLTKVKEHHK